MALFPEPVYQFVAVNAAYTAKTNDFINATVAAAYTITLPPASQGGVVSVRKVDSAAFAFTLKTADGATIDGVSGTTGITSGTSQHVGFTVASDGANWWVIGI